MRVKKKRLTPTERDFVDLLIQHGTRNRDNLQYHLGISPREIRFIRLSLLKKGYPVVSTTDGFFLATSKKQKRIAIAFCDSQIEGIAYTRKLISNLLTDGARQRKLVKK